ncbi:hypothetical protein C0Q70_15165 [Pomacea canaliculata]|uniref:Phosphoserine phosphatase n=2 Tax=Pomacea canaliculata TaxID=400727 RepID=A0A2T7NU30_POMCA|nr:phosphoserine phosphatase-like isoform X2 [Pomacea canaliculata]PVD24680.1 hypothetical protein C0Q70_15165 [Pomacea canaliculata]
MSSVSNHNEVNVRELWRTADAVCFDVDSTVCKDEGLDELAEFCGAGAEVREWTNKAMGGDVTFREALTQRLNIVKPSQQQLEAFITSRPPQLTDGIKDLVSLLHSKNVPVFLVSGGFRNIIEPAAKILNIPLENVYANKLLFKDGLYDGFDPKEPTSDSGGKQKVAELLKQTYGFKCLIMIGDGATDMEAAPPADAFIGFGGNVVREKVKKNAKWFVTDFKELIKPLQEPQKNDLL